PGPPPGARRPWRHATLPPMRLARTLIGMLHLQPLPGSPRWEGSMARVIDGALADARALVDGGMDALLVENYGDAPFTAGRVAAATVAGGPAVGAGLCQAGDGRLPRRVAARRQRRHCRDGGRAPLRSGRGDRRHRRQA